MRNHGAIDLTLGPGALRWGYATIFYNWGFLLHYLFRELLFEY